VRGCAHRGVGAVGGADAPGSPGPGTTCVAAGRSSMRGMLSGRAVEMSMAVEAGGLPGAAGITAPGVVSGAAWGGSGRGGALRQGHRA